MAEKASAIAASFQRQGRWSPRTGLRQAFQRRIPRTAYSERWPPLRKTSWTREIVSSEMSGLNQRKIGPMIREVRRVGKTTVEGEKNTSHHQLTSKPKKRKKKGQHTKPNITSGQYTQIEFV